MGSTAQDEEIILYVILGAIGALGMGYAMARYCTSPESFETDTFSRPSPEQDEYMREVRMRNQNILMDDARAKRPGRKGKQPFVSQV